MTHSGPSINAVKDRIGPEIRRPLSPGALAAASTATSAAAVTITTTNLGSGPALAVPLGSYCTWDHASTVFVHIKWPGRLLGVHTALSPWGWAHACTPHHQARLPSRMLHWLIRLHLQITSSKVKVLSISRQWRQNIKPNALCNSTGCLPRKPIW